MGDLKLYGKTDNALDLLIQTFRTYNFNACVEFWTEKCNILVLKRDIKDENCHIMLPNDLKISLLKKGENYKYLRIVEVEDINTKKIKEKVRAEFLNAPEKFLSHKSIVEISSKL